MKESTPVTALVHLIHPFPELMLKFRHSVGFISSRLHLGCSPFMPFLSVSSRWAHQTYSQLTLSYLTPLYTNAYLVLAL